jgi:hypothetical protein
MRNNDQVGSGLQCMGTYESPSCKLRNPRLLSLTGHLLTLSDQRRALSNCALCGLFGVSVTFTQAADVFYFSDQHTSPEPLQGKTS